MWGGRIAARLYFHWNELRQNLVQTIIPTLRDDVDNRSADATNYQYTLSDLYLFRLLRLFLLIFFLFLLNSGFLLLRKFV